MIHCLCDVGDAYATDAKDGSELICILKLQVGVLSVIEIKRKNGQDLTYFSSDLFLDGRSFQVRKKLINIIQYQI